MTQARPTAAALLHQPAGPTIAGLCVRLLDGIEGAAERLRAHDGESVHELRVALRRLRSVLRAFRPEFAGVVRKRDRRSLAALARASGRARDAEVQAELVASQDGSAACARIVRRLGKEARDARARFVQRRLPRIDRLVSALRDEFAGMAAGVTFAAAMADRIRAGAARVAQCVAAITDADDQAAIHATRIAGKHLRYLIELLGDAAPHAAAILVELEQMQDALGEVHDHQVLRARLGKIAADDKGADLAAMRDRLHTGIGTQFARFRDRWATAARTSFFAAVETLALELLRSESPAAGRSTAEATTRSPAPARNAVGDEGEE